MLCWLLLGCPPGDDRGDDSGTPTRITRTISVDYGIPLFGAVGTGGALAVADLAGDDVADVVFFEQRFSDASGAGAAVGVYPGPVTARADLLVDARYQGYRTIEPSLFGYPFTPLSDGRVLAADWAVQCDGDGAVWILDGPFDTTAWNGACASSASWERIRAPDDVVGFGVTVLALPGGFAVGAPESGVVFVWEDGAERRLDGPPSFGTGLEAADLDGDGVVGLVVGAPDAGLVEVEEDGTRLEGAVGFGAALAAGDLTGDGRDDLVVAVRPDDGAPEGSVWLYPSPPAADTAVWVGAAGWVFHDGPTIDLPGDLDGDGYGELVTAAAGEEDAVAVWFGPFPSRRALRVEGPGGSGRSGLGRAMAHGDVDGDGRTDLVLAAPLEAGYDRPGIFVLTEVPAP